MERIIITRHNATLEWLRQHPDWADAPAIFSRDVFPEDVQGKIVAGNLPLHLAALAAEVHAVEFAPGQGPRGRDYGIAEMEAAGVHLARYQVRSI